jgi:hypothetical protein
MHQDGERLTVSITGPLDEVSIHIDLYWAGSTRSGLPTITAGNRQNVQTPVTELLRSRSTTSRQRPAISRPIRS